MLDYQDYYLFIWGKLELRPKSILGSPQFHDYSRNAIASKVKQDSRFNQLLVYSSCIQHSCSRINFFRAVIPGIFPQKLSCSNFIPKEGQFFQIVKRQNLGSEKSAHENIFENNCFGKLSEKMKELQYNRSAIFCNFSIFHTCRQIISIFDLDFRGYKDPRCT